MNIIFKESLKLFAEEVRIGLRGKLKSLPSKYFYDETGDNLFQQIMKMPEYYLTPCEFEILTNQKKQILDLFVKNEPFDLIELGAGDGHKTRILIEHLLLQGVDFKYIPVDISANVLDILAQRLKTEFPNLQIESQEEEYFQALQNISSYSSRPKMVLFLGSNIGNFNYEEMLEFFQQISNSLNPGDALLVGYDLKKDPQIILNAYNDAAGITRNFNLNILTRINRELGGDFILDNFTHFPIYDPVLGAAKSYLVSKKKQVVTIDALEESFLFERSEPIYTEISQKYDNLHMDSLAHQFGFKVVKHFTDSKCYFVDALWIK